MVVGCSLLFLKMC